jgi:hypothetical protein
MPLSGGKYRVKTTKSGEKVRLHFKDGEVDEAVNLDSGAKHTPSEFAADKKARKKKAKTRKRSLPWSSQK